MMVAMLTNRAVIAILLASANQNMSSGDMLRSSAKEPHTHRLAPGEPAGLVCPHGAFRCKAFAAFREGLEKLGWVEGREVSIEYRWSAKLSGGSTGSFLRKGPNGPRRATWVP